MYRNEFSANLALASIYQDDQTNSAKFKAWAMDKERVAQKDAEASMARAAKRAGHVQPRESFLSKLINLFK